MKKLTLICLMAGLSMTVSSLEAAQNNGDTATRMTSGSSPEALSVITRPGRPRPPQLVHETSIEVITRPGRPRPPHFLEGLEEAHTGEF